MMIRIASYNLQKCVGLDMRRRPERSLHVINNLQADIVVLQEADKRLAPRPAALPHQLLSSDGWQIVPLDTSAGSLGWHGNAIITRAHIDIADMGHITLPGLEPRGAVWCDLNTPIGPLRVIGAHLGLLQRYRLQQISAIGRALLRLPYRPTVLAGDFNEWRRGSALEDSIGALSFLPGHASFPAPRPVAALDRLALSSDLRAVAHGSYGHAPARVASDHLPIWVDLSQATHTL